MNKAPWRAQAPADLEMLEAELQKPHVYAPPATRQAISAQETTLEQIHALTKELDQTIAAAEAEISHLKQETIEVRDAYLKHTTRIVKDIQQLQEGVKLSMDTMRSLKAQVAQLAMKEPS